MNRRNRKMKKLIPPTIRTVFMLLIAGVLLFPFFVLVTRSFMTWQEATSIPTPVFPEALNWGSYMEAVAGEFFIYLKNTLIVLVFNVLGVTFSAYFVAYGFAKTEFFGKNIIFAIALATMMLPGIVTQLSLYVIYHKIGWLNTLFPMIIPPLFGGGMINIFLIRQYLMTIPKSYTEAAKVDGAKSFQICTRIIMPMAKPVMMLTAVNTFMACWNDFTTPLMYIDSTRTDKFTLAVGIFNRFRGAVTYREQAPNEQMALCVLLMIPSLILFAFFQKTLIEGVSLNGVKA